MAEEIPETIEKVFNMQALKNPKALKPTPRETLDALTIVSRALCGRVSGLTILSYGGGQDSKAILTKLIHDLDFRAQYAPSKLLVIMSDTGDEHSYTYADIRQVKTMCKDAGFEFHFLDSSKGFHSRSWPDLITPQITNGVKSGHPTMVQMGTKSCTLNLKIEPIYKFLDAWLNTEYCYDFKEEANGTTGKKALKRFHAEEGKIRVLIGFADHEESRAIKSRRLEINTIKKVADVWQKAIYREFPLIDHGLTRAGCQALIASYGYNVPMPSNCMRCPYMSNQELLWLHRNAPAKFEQWEAIEKSKQDRDNAKPPRYTVDKRTGKKKLVPNNGVFGSLKTLGQKLNEALKSFGHWTDQELNDYKNNHGCNANVF